MLECSLRLYDLVKSVGAVSVRRLERAAAEAGRRGEALSAILVRRGEIEASQLAELVSRLVQIRRVPEGGVQPLSPLNAKVPSEYQKKARLVLLRGRSDPLLAMSDPTDADARAVVESLIGRSVEVVVIDENTLSAILNRAHSATASVGIDLTVAQALPADENAFSPLPTHVDLLSVNRATSSIVADDDYPTDATEREPEADADGADDENDIASVAPTRVDARASDFTSRGVPNTVGAAEGSES